MDRNVKQGLIIAAASVGTVILLILVMMAGLPKYGEWKKGVNGRADLAKAESTRKIAIVEAQANLEAERMNAKAEIARAKGAAEAIKIEGGKLTDQYIKYLWIRQQKPGAGQVIYIPTEAGLPILEAGKNRK